MLLSNFILQMYTFLPHPVLLKRELWVHNKILGYYLFYFEVLPVYSISCCYNKLLLRSISWSHCCNACTCVTTVPPRQSQPTPPPFADALISCFRRKLSYHSGSDLPAITPLFITPTRIALSLSTCNLFR